jgi:hypothetical protein
MAEASNHTLEHAVESLQNFIQGKQPSSKLNALNCGLVQHEMVSGMLSSLIKDTDHSQIMF